MKILVVEDDLLVARSIGAALKESNMYHDIVNNGSDAMYYIDVYSYDLIILDLMLPDVTGYEVLKHCREKNIKTPVLILSGLSEAPEKVRSLNDGADDYLTKPFNKTELIARINAIVRRSKGFSDSIVQVGEITINLSAQTVSVNQKPVKLTGKEYAIVELLALNMGKVMSKYALLDHMYGVLEEPNPKILDVFICKIRKKIESLCKDEFIFIQTVWGQGYILNSNATKTYNN